MSATDSWSETFHSGADRVVVSYSSSTQTVLAERYRGDELVEVTADPDRIKQWADKPVATWEDE